MKPLLLLILLLTSTCLLIFFFRSHSIKSKAKFVYRPNSNSSVFTYQRIKAKAVEAKQYTNQNGYSTRYQFLIDMRLPSSHKRFYVYDAVNDSIVDAGLVAHGSCQKRYLESAQFSNTPNSGCSSMGRYKIGRAYPGRFGTAYKLHGLDSTNSQAFVRNVVLHAYDCVPTEETGTLICNSLGCPMVSYNFLNRLSNIIEASPQPVLLWIFD